ncbi:VRR-NUC domain-containing protein [Vibrio genomosp. F6]|uniref:VRR-NUC domain-containing protein n=1 Tax=Vibrio genomosp. F6 TaxID=723172 RepID=UPI0010BDF7D2|nr:VRR-NUC domain-containing protein [Vibrio genomosp. F6]TKF14857.1 VRR-NUC domain-containing protein [Vibrio genomosp. F6]
MKFNVKETVFSYPQSMLDEWKIGHKEWIPESLFVPNEVYNQPRYHFGEYFALKQYLDAGWQGTAYYALGDWEPNNVKYDQGRAIVAKYIDPIRLTIFKALRQGLTSGEPDLMLYKEDGSVLFVEVKKESDRISKSQLICLAQIKSILGCDVAVTYLTESNKVYKAKTYELDILEVPQSCIERN